MGYNYALGGKKAGDFALPKSASYMEEDVFSTAPDYSTYTYGDMQRAQARGNERAALAAGVGALGAGAQIAAAALPTAADVENEKRLKELAKHKGLTQAQRAEIDEQAMRKVNAYARESQHRTDEALAASGQHSAADLYRARLAEKNALNAATIGAADIGIRENRAQVQRDVDEEQERIDEKAARQREVKGLIAQAIAGGVMATAKPLAAGLVQDEPTDAQLLWMQSAKDKNGNPLYPGLQNGATPDDIRLLYRKDMQQRRKADGAPMITP